MASVLHRSACNRIVKPKMNVWYSLGGTIWLIFDIFFSHAGSIALWQCQSVGRPVGPPLWSRLKYQQLSDGLPWNLVGYQHSWFCRWWIQMTFPLAPPWGLHLWFWVKCLNNYWMAIVISLTQITMCHVEMGFTHCGFVVTHTWVTWPQFHSALQNRTHRHKKLATRWI